MKLRVLVFLAAKQLKGVVLQQTGEQELLLAEEWCGSGKACDLGVAKSERRRKLERALRVPEIPSACGIVFFWNTADWRINNLRFGARAVLERPNTMESVGGDYSNTPCAPPSMACTSKRCARLTTLSIASLLLTTVPRQTADLFICNSQGLVDRFNSIRVIAWASGLSISSADAHAMLVCLPSVDPVMTLKSESVTHGSCARRRTGKIS